MASPIEPGWSAWRPVEPFQTLTPSVLAEILDGGQAFRWKQDELGWQGFFDRFVVRLKLDDKALLSWSAPKAMERDVGAPLTEYLQAKRPLAELVDTMPWRSDPHLARCLAAFPGLRILRQPFGETLLGFLCSATKQIVQIKQMVGGSGPVCNQVLYHVEERAIEYAVLPWCERNGAALVAYSPFGHGNFPDPQSPRGRILKQIAGDHGATPRQVALRFLLRNPAVFTIPKSSNPDHVAENAGAGDLRLSDAELEQIDQAFPRGPRPKELPML